jgi:hypothetical protein
MSDFVIASPAPASPGEAGGAKRRSNLVFLTRKPECPAPAPTVHELHLPGLAGASLPSPEVHEGRRSPPLPPLREGEREGEGEDKREGGRKGKLAMTSLLFFLSLLGRSECIIQGVFSGISRLYLMYLGLIQALDRK